MAGGKISNRENPPEKSINVTAKALAPQLGSSNEILTEQRIDERKFATLNSATQTALGYFDFRAKVDGVRFFDHIVKWYLVTSQALDGKRARQVLQAIQAEAGTKALETVERPNIFARNITNRNWKEKALQEGKVPVE